MFDLYFAGVHPSPKPWYKDTYNLGFNRLASYADRRELDFMELFLAGENLGFHRYNSIELGCNGSNYLASYEEKYRSCISAYIYGMLIRKYQEDTKIRPEFVKESLEKLNSYFEDKTNLPSKVYEELCALAENKLINYQDKEDEKLIELYLVGPECEEVTNTAINSKSNMLMSYARNSGIEKYIPQFNEPCKGKLFIDSGAFTAWTKGKEIDVDEYIKFINDRSDYIYLYGQIDSIPGTRSGCKVTTEMIIESANKTWENYLYMRPKMKNPEGLLYTFHVGEPLEFLKRALEWKDDKGQYIPYIALGGMVGKPKQVREAFLESCFEVISSSPNPNVKVHAFGMTDFDLLAKYPIASADSTSWILTGATGMIMSDYGNITVSDVQKNEPNHYSHLPEQAQIKLNESLAKFGFTLEDLKDSRENRIILNARYMMDKASKLVQKPFKAKKKLF